MTRKTWWADKTCKSIYPELWDPETQTEYITFGDEENLFIKPRREGPVYTDEEQMQIVIDHVDKAVQCLMEANGEYWVQDSPYRTDKEGLTLTELSKLAVDLQEFLGGRWGERYDSGASDRLQLLIESALTAADHRIREYER